jgi:hypothetical protein
MQQQQPQNQIKIELGEKEAEGIYANLAMVMHSPTEIVIDFARAMPRTPKARVLSRIIMTPTHAKVLAKTLEQDIKKFEAQFGEIKLHKATDAGSKPIGFESSDNFQSGEDQ